MGQRQSSSSAAEAQEPIQTSYYELLGVERQATDDEIKKAYRRKALELHPDRNYGKEEQATKLFSEIQAAYEVLSDPQERAWYDSHESAILRGGDVGEDHFEGSVRVTTAEDVTAMIGKFNGRVKFDDSAEGFFGFLRDAFARLAKEEEIAADLEGTDIPDYPTFGHKDDTHDDVVQDFYKAWANFSTKKSFAWKDIYRLNEAPDRRIKRLMEKDNKKRRDEGIREFNDAVRALIAFVRKRDPRYTPNTQSEAERQKALREASAAQAARARAANAAKMDEYVPEWAQTREPDEEEVSSAEEGEDEVEQIQCVACHKTFKSEKQFEAHEKSKKHQKAVYALRKKMQKDNARFNLDEDMTSSGIMTPQEKAVSEEEDEMEEDVPNVKDLDLEDEEETMVASDDSDDDHQTKPTKITKNADEGSEQDDEDSDYAPRSAFTSRLDNTLANSEEQFTSTSVSKDDDDNDAPRPAQKKMGKAALKRAKKAAKVAEAESEEASFKCVRCNAAFPSKTKLFDHIKALGHAAPVSSGKGKAGKRR